MSSAERGLLITMEGGEGSGKSTQGRRLAERLDALFTFEPGDTAVGARLRALLLEPSTGDLDARAEALLMAADRAQHVAEVIRPALAEGRHVVTDRYVPSSVAYQGYGRGIPVDDVIAVSEFATGGLSADLVVYLKVPLPVAQARLGHSLDRMEQAGAAFHQRVHQGFAAQAQADPRRWIVVDGTADVDDVSAAVWSAVSERLGVRVESRGSE